MVELPSPNWRGGERRERYMDFVIRTIPDAELKLIREALQRGQLTGSAKFVEDVEQIVRRRVELRGQGRSLKDK